MEQSGEGQGGTGMPELTLGKAWTERTSGNMEKHGEGWRSRGVQDAHANREPAWAPAAQCAVWIHSQHVFLHCLLMTFHLKTVLPYSARQYVRWVKCGKPGQKWWDVLCSS